MRTIFIILAIVCGFGAWISYDARNNKSDYEYACLYISQSIEESRSCGDVYPENHESYWTTWLVLSVIGAGFFGMLALDAEPRQEYREPEED